jgi:hypothetical protein
MENTKLKEKETINPKPPKPFSTGWCYQPVLKVSHPPALARATWWPLVVVRVEPVLKGGDL